MRRLLPLIIASAAALSVLPASAGAAGKSCAKRPGTLATANLGRVWHQGRSLYACTTANSVAPKARRMGPWTPSTRVAWDGEGVAWTTRVTRAGVQVDRLWAGHAATGARWLSGAQAVPASDGEPAGEARVLRLRTVGDAVTWVTDASQLALASEEPNTDDLPTTLPEPGADLKPDENRVLVGAWPQTPAAQLAATLRLTLGEGEGDDCGGVDIFDATVRPSGATTPVGAVWSSAYSVTSSECNT